MPTMLSAVGEKFIRSTAAGLLAQTSYALGHYDEFERLSAEVEELATDDDIDAQALSRCVRGKILARRGEFDEAEAVVREALAILEPTDAVLFKFGALLDLAEVLRLAGRDADAHAAVEQARAQAADKASEAMSSAARGVLAALDSSLVR